MRKSKMAREAKKLKKEMLITEEEKARREFLDSLYDDMKNAALLSRSVDQMTQDTNDNAGDDINEQK